MLGLTWKRSQSLGDIGEERKIIFTTYMNAKVWNACYSIIPEWLNVSGCNLA